MTPIIHFGTGMTTSGLELARGQFSVIYIILEQGGRAIIQTARTVRDEVNVRRCRSLELVLSHPTFQDLLLPSSTIPMDPI